MKVPALATVLALFTISSVMANTHQEVDHIAKRAHHHHVARNSGNNAHHAPEHKRHTRGLKSRQSSGTGPKKLAKCAASKSTSSLASVSSTSVAATSTTSTTTKKTPTPSPTPYPTQPPPPPPPPKTTIKSDNDGGSGGGTQYGGDGTFYTPGLNACGTKDQSTDYIAAVAHDFFDNFPGSNGNPNDNPICQKKVRATYQGVSIEVRLTDKCMGCVMQSLDFSPAAFQNFAPLAVGRIHGLVWEFVDN